MPGYITYMNVASYVLGAIALLCWFVASYEAPAAKTIIKLLGFGTGGPALVCYGLTLALPDLLSPRETIVGSVSEFRQVSPSQYYSYFEFTVQDEGRTGHRLHSEYFDKGFYFGDPLLYDGVIVTATYLTWNGQVLAITELSGRHAGWSSQSEASPLGPWIFFFTEIALMLGGFLRTVSDRLAEPQEP